MLSNDSVPRTLAEPTNAKYWVSVESVSDQCRVIVGSVSGQCRVSFRSVSVSGGNPGRSDDSEVQKGPVTNCINTDLFSDNSCLSTLHTRVRLHLRMLCIMASNYIAWPCQPSTKPSMEVIIYTSRTRKEGRDLGLRDRRGGGTEGFREGYGRRDILRLIG